MRHVNSNEVSFDETFIVWHIATNALYSAVSPPSQDVDSPSGQNVDPNTISDDRNFSKVISDYMLYLLAMEPDIMLIVAGVGQQRIIEI